MKASTPGLLWNGTAHAESAAFRALEAAKKAQRAAELATNIANQNQEATQAAITAQHQNLSSPVKVGELSAKSPPNPRVADRWYPCKLDK